MIAIKSGAELWFQKCITSKTTIQRIKILHLGRFLHSKTREKDEIPEVHDHNPDSKYTKQVKEISDYLKDTNFTEHIHKVPLEMMERRKSTPDCLYLVDAKAADQIVDLIIDDILADPSKLIEMNPGIGLITRRLMARKIPLLHVMERCAKFIPFHVELQKTYPGRLIIQEADMLRIRKLAALDKYDEGRRVANLLSDFTPAKWGAESGLKMIGSITSLSFIKHLVMDTVRQNGIAYYGTPWAYLFVPPSIWTQLASGREAGLKNYRGISVLFQIFFDYELLAELPRKAFIPWTPVGSLKKRPQARALQELDRNLMYVIRIRGKSDLFTNVIDRKDLQSLWFFVNHHMIARTRRLIPSMEAWQPDCGPSLIMQDFNIFTQFGDLSAQQILNLFKQFTTWDAYKTSFEPSMENSLQKMEHLVP